MANLKNLTVTEKRIAILKDAITQIKAEKYIIMASNGYVLGDIEDRIEDYQHAACILNIKPNKIQLKDHLDKIIEDTTCEVCAKGALFLSSIRKFNNFSLNEALDGGLDGKASSNVRTIFGKANADEIENYFEHDNYTFGSKVSTQYDVNEGNVGDLTLRDKWLYMYPEDADRLLAIFKNALKNDGIFKPEQLKFKLRK